MITISAREIIDSRKRPTLEVEARYNGSVVTASVPSGKSTGSREAVELRDIDGGVSKAIENSNGEIADLLSRLELEPLIIDAELRKLDGTSNYSRLGANSILAVSIAMRRLAAKEQNIPLWQYIAKESGSVPKFPALFMNMINGGAHAGFSVTFQEHIVIVAGTPSVSYEKAKEIFNRLGSLIKAKYGDLNFGDEGGYAPTLPSEDEAFRLLTESIGSDAGIKIAIDAAATSFFKDNLYQVDSKKLSSDELRQFYIDLISRYPLVSIEDPFEEFDESSFATLLSSTPKEVLIVGDDLTATNRERVKKLSNMRAVNAMIVKPNQVGTLLDVYEAVKVTRDGGWKLIASHRSGETTDDFLADFAVGIGADGMKAGVPTQLERRVKYERLLAIEKESLGEIGV